MYPPEFTPTALSDTIANSVSSFFVITSSLAALKAAKALAQQKAALLDNPPPAGTLPSARISISTALYSPYFSRSKPAAPFKPALK
jgi:hypothetical protein